MFMLEKSVHTIINQQNGNLAFKISQFDNNSNFDHLQRNNYYTLIWVTKGNGILKADFSEYNFDKNSLFAFYPYQPFMLSENQKLEGVEINFHPDFFCIHRHNKEVACNGILFNNIYQPPFVYVDEKSKEIFSILIEQIFNEMKTIGLEQYEVLVSFLKVFLITATRLKVDQHKIVEFDTIKNKKLTIIQDLKNAIDKNYKELHTASDYSSLLNISANALAKITKAYFNKTLTDLIAERIIIEAKRELYLTKKPIKEIAYELGYNDELYFSRFFKTNVDVSPQMYRETVGFDRGMLET
jgi:AraC family transcriptional regulator, transcriptional activator of pobA